MPTLLFDCTGLDIGTAYVTDLRRRPVADSFVTRDGDTLAVTLQRRDTPVQLHVSTGVEGFGRTFCTANNSGEGYTAPGKFDLLRELALSHLRRAECVAAEVPAPLELPQAREQFALSAWQDRRKHGMAALALALVAGEEAARAAAEHALANRAAPMPLISATLFGERLDEWSIGVGPDWDVNAEPPDFVRPAAENAHLTALCNATTLPNFWRWIEPTLGSPRWHVLDKLIEYAQQHNLAVKSFALFWAGIGGSPVWLRGLPHKAKLHHIERWITEVVRRYKDQIAAWETVNEMHDWGFGDGYGWSQTQKLEVTRLVNELVGALDPGKPRIINHCVIWGEYVQNQPGRWTPLSYLDDVIRSGIPFEGIGVQYYNPGRDLLECAMQLDTYAEFGKSLWITEMGTPSDPRPRERVETAQLDPLVGWRGPWSPELQADWVELWYTLASARPAVKALNWWDFGDSRAFIAHAGLINAANQAKPAYKRLMDWCQRHKSGRFANQP